MAKTELEPEHQQAAASRKNPAQQLRDRVRRHPALDFRPKTDDGNHLPIDRVVFGVTSVLAIGFLVWGFVSTSSLSTASSKALDWTMSSLDWFFVLTASGFVVFALWLAASKFGSITLGPDGEPPEFRTSSWIAMMFSAGMGIGLMFYGVSEPLTFFADKGDFAIPGTSGQSQDELARTAMAQTLFHWTLHPWAIYAVVGLAIAYGTFRKGRRQLISSTFIPLLGRKRAEGPAGRVIDILAIFATLFGSAASLGLGALQIASGLEIVGGIGKVGNAVLIGIIVVLTICFIFSAVSGVEKGIQLLSNVNMVLAIGLALFVFVVGPTMFILDMLPTTLASYIGDLAEMSGRTNAEGEAAATWLASYTVFYWAWWISWTPFVGMFIARISKGRTIRQFVSGVLLVPSVVTLIWFAIFGGSAIKVQMDGTDIYGKGGAESQLFSLLETFPWATAASIVVMVLTAIFFVSGADAASIVMGTLSQRGAIEPKEWAVVFWGVATGGVAAVMLLVGGEDALSGLQTITIISAVPFVVVMVGVCVALVKDLNRDPLIVRAQVARSAVHQAVVTGVTAHGDDFRIPVEADPERGSDRSADEPVDGVDRPER